MGDFDCCPHDVGPEEDEMSTENLIGELRAITGGRSVSEYTPIDSDIRTAWMVHHIDGTNESPMPMNEWESEFDRWLFEHDRLVAERAWDEGFTRGFYAGQAYPDGTDASEPDIDNPYRKEQENNNA